MAVTHTTGRPRESGHHLNVGQAERWGSVLIGSALVGYGLTRRTKTGAGLAAAGTTLIFLGTTGHRPLYGRIGFSAAEGRDTREALGGPKGFHVRESIRLEKPIDEVYRFWRQLENLPQFMSHLEKVVDLGNGHSHWIATGPGGMSVEWDAEIINEVGNKVIGWRSLPDSDVVTAGSVNFDSVRQGRSTQVSVNLQYALPGGRLTRFVAALFGDEPAQAIREDLRRLKWLLEAGEIPRATAEQRPGRWSI